MRSIKQLQQILEAQARAIGCRQQKIYSNNLNIAIIDADNVVWQQAIDGIRHAQHEAQFELMNQLSHRCFMRYMRRHYGW